MSDVECHGLRFGGPLFRFLHDEALPGSGVDPNAFFAAFARLIEEFGPTNCQLIERRRQLQESLDSWHRDRARRQHDASAYRAMLEEIGYLVAGPAPFRVETQGVDAELSTIAGPQLVVPATNSRYALNAANARWGSLFDALYGTDAMGSPPPPGPYDPARGARVVEWTRRHLDEVVPLATASHGDVTGYRVVGGALRVTVERGGETTLVEPRQFVGFTGDAAAPSGILLERHGLHIELVLDRTHPVGAADPVGLADVLVEAAVSAIVDLEDSAATVDAFDKAAAYRNWLGFLYGGRRLDDGAKLDADPAVRIECELGLHLSDHGEIRAVCAAVELVRPDFGSPSDLTGPNLAACNIAADRFLTGPFQPWAGPPEGLVTVTHDDTVVLDAGLTDSLGGPEAAAQWLRAEAAQRDIVLWDDLLFITGTCGHALPLLPGSYEVDFAGLGTLHFEAR